MLTQERLKELLHYEPDTGLFTWLKSNNNRIKIGNPAGSIYANGYLNIRIDGKVYSAHRLSFLYIRGELPKLHVDHIDGNPSNNRWNNLRECSISENHQNRVANSNSTSKYIGVSWRLPTNKWMAQIQVNGKVNYLGYFDTPELASKAYEDFAKNYHGKFYYKYGQQEIKGAEL